MDTRPGAWDPAGDEKTACSPPRLRTLEEPAVWIRGAACGAGGPRTFADGELSAAVALRVLDLLTPEALAACAGTGHSWATGSSRGSDLKADRARGTLRVPGAVLEPGVAPAGVAAALAVELRRMADWLGLERVRMGARGDLAGPLRRAVRRS